MLWQLLWLATLTQPAVANSLPIPDTAQSLPPPEDNIRMVQTVLTQEGSGLESWRLHLVPMDRKLFVTGPFNPTGTSRVERFGKWQDYKRYTLDWKGKPEFIRGIWQHQNKVILLDGVLSLTLEYSLRDDRIVNQRSIPWDLVHPARDGKGEPTWTERSQLRARFRKAYLGTQQARFIGAERAPKSFNRHDRHDIFLGTRIKGFPLLTLSCEDEDANCLVKRACFVTGQNHLDPADTTGFALSAKRRQLLFLQKAARKIVIFQYSSCFHSGYKKSLTLPERLKEVTSLHVDQSDRLWITTRYPDDYENSSVFFWRPDQW